MSVARAAVTLCSLRIAAITGWYNSPMRCSRRAVSGAGDHPPDAI